MSLGCCLKPSCTLHLIFWDLLYQRELLAESVSMLNLPQKQIEGLGFLAPSRAEGWILVAYRSCSSFPSRNNGECKFWAFCSHRVWSSRVDLDGCTFLNFCAGIRISASPRSKICSVCAATERTMLLWDSTIIIKVFERTGVALKGSPLVTKQEQNPGSLLTKRITG